MTRLFVTILASAALAGTAAHAVTWDTNDDGTVDAAEFAKGNSAALTFDRFDDNDDGAITPREVGLTEPDEVFLAADNNGDGALTPSELTEGTFNTYDRNNDGSLDTEEMKIFEYEESIRQNPFAGEAGKTKR